MRRFNSACLTAFPASGAGRPLQQSFGDFPEFTHVTACRFAARPNRTLVRGASTGRLPAPIVPVATQANRKFLRRDFHSQDTDTFHGAPGRLRMMLRHPEIGGPICGKWAETNLARCFRCEKNFNPIDMVMEANGATFLEALEFLSPFI